MTAEVGPLLTAVLGANLLTAMFIYGMVQASKVWSDKDQRLTHILQILVPLAFFGGGVYLYW